MKFPWLLSEDGFRTFHWQLSGSGLGSMKTSGVNSKLCSWSNYLIIIAQISWNSLEAAGSVCCCREDPARDEALGYFRLAVSRVCLVAGNLAVGLGFGCNCNALLFAEAQPPSGWSKSISWYTEKCQKGEIQVGQ